MARNGSSDIEDSSGIQTDFFPDDQLITSLHDLITGSDGKTGSVKKMKELLVDATSAPNAEIDPRLMNVMEMHGWNSGQCSFSSENEETLRESLATALGKLRRKSIAKRSLFKRRPLATLLEATPTGAGVATMSYCPDMAYLAVREACKLGSEQLQPCQLYFQGVCLLADISGFTKLCGQMCQQGTAGLDSLHAFLKAFISKVVNIVYSYGGDGTISLFLLFFQFCVLT